MALLKFRVFLHLLKDCLVGLHINYMTSNTVKRLKAYDSRFSKRIQMVWPLGIPSVLFSALLCSLRFVSQYSVFSWQVDSG